jgi:uncharacterized protein
MTRAKPTVQRLRAHAINGSLFRPTTLPSALERLGFVQADPIRAPARAQDLILRHRVKGYRAGDLERRYPAMALEEDVLYAYGFVPREVGRLIRAPDRRGLSRLESEVLAAVRELGDTHPRQLDARFGSKRTTNAWGGVSRATKRALEGLHRRGLLRVARRDNGIRVYAPAPDGAEVGPPTARFRDLVMIAARILAPAARARLVSALAPLRRRIPIDARTARAVVDDLIATGELATATVGGTCFVWPAGKPPSEAGEPVVRLLAPFDPLVWDRQRFEQFWGWSYRFEAYTPKRARVRDVQKLFELDLETRLALVQELWNSIVDDAAAGIELPLSAETRALLDERLSEDDEDPGSAIAWADARAKLRRDR